MEYVTHLPKEDPSIATTSTYGLQFTYPVKYYDFHVYYYAHNDKSDKEARALLNKLLNENQTARYLNLVFLEGKGFHLKTLIATRQPFKDAIVSAVTSTNAHF